MITGIGIDSIEKQRIKEAVSRWGERFLGKIYTSGELRDCERKNDRLGSLAVRFAAKEAVLKALGTGWSEGIGWKDIEILNGPGGKPEVLYHRKSRNLVQKNKTHLSLTHDQTTASAFVIIETEEG